MKRRDLIVLSGVALAAGGRVARAEEVNTVSKNARAAVKTLLKLDRTKGSYQVPKTVDKATRYVNSLSNALALTSDQQQAASTVFFSAVTVRGSIRERIKAARKSLAEAVLANDSSAIGQNSQVIGSLKGQWIGVGASAHSAFLRLLTLEQQAKIGQYRS